MPYKYKVVGVGYIVMLKYYGKGNLLWFHTRVDCLSHNTSTGFIILSINESLGFTRKYHVHSFQVTAHCTACYLPFCPYRSRIGLSV